MLQEKLKASTALLHDELENLMFVKSIMQRTLNVPQYRQILLTNYLAHLYYEEQIHQSISKQLAEALNIDKRKKTDALIADLRDVNLSVANLAKKFPVAEVSIPSESFALGAMYVLEGATLGGSVIVKQLLLNPNFPRDYSFNYYNVYAKDLMKNWQQFVAVLNTLPDEEHEQAIDGATFMFSAIAQLAKQIKDLEVEKSKDN